MHCTDTQSACHTPKKCMLPHPPGDLGAVSPNSPAFKDTDLLGKTLYGTVSLSSSFLSIYDGKDKSLKLLQYFLKILTEFKILSRPSSTSAISKAAKNLSFARRLFRLGRPLGSLLELVELSCHADRCSCFSAFYVLLEALSNGLDDFCTFCKLFSLTSFRPIETSWLPLADKGSILAWWITLHMDLYILAQKRPSMPQSMAKVRLRIMQSHAYRLQCVSLLKLLSDYVFCMIDYCQFESKSSAKIRTLCGFCSALCSVYKIYYKQSQHPQ
jgi:hypothetical protein